MTAEPRCAAGEHGGVISMRFRILAVFVGCLTAAMLLGASGCEPSADENPTTSGEQARSEASDSSASDEAAAPDADRIPPGREIAEGGGGPVTYTFREEWRRALDEAAAWRSGARLVSAVGQYVNNDGVPSEWRFTFVEGSAPDALLWIYIDPWGNVTETREEIGDAVTSNVSEYDKPLPYDVIDSDQAVTIATEALAAQYSADKLRDPRIALGWSVLDGSGPYWEYDVFYTSNASYVNVRIDARSGEVVSLQ